MSVTATRLPELTDIIPVDRLDFKPQAPANVPDHPAHQLHSPVKREGEREREREREKG